MKASVSIRNISFTYGNSTKKALRDLSGDMIEGDFVAILGRGGAGKSTLCYTLNGLVPRFFRGDYSGIVNVMGREAYRSGIAEMSRTVGLVLQDFETQLFSTNVELEVAFGPENLGLSREEIGRRITKYLAFTGMDVLRSRDSSNLSGGQKQRLAIASVLAMESPVLVMDEPTTDLDPLGRQHILELSRRLSAQVRTLIVADNEPENVIHADWIWLLKDGELVAVDRPGRILTDIALLESCGVMVLPTVALFHAMKWPGTPLTGDEAISLIEEKRLAIPKGKHLFSTPVTPKGNGAVLEAKDLCFRYPAAGTKALENINFKVSEGEFVAILGQNGSGKTTLAKHFNGIFKPTSGKMFVKGKPTEAINRRDLARTVGYVFQNPDHQIFANTVKEEVAFGLRTLGESPETVDQRVEEALAITGLTGYEDRSPFLLTKGERQRVAVASVLSVKPEVIILDEPTTGLDYAFQRETMEMLKEINLRGHTIIIITHAMWIAESYATRTVIMGNGRIIADGKTRRVFADEGVLAEASLSPSPLVRLSNYLGAGALTLQGLIQELIS
ncbi:MAG: ABC transporter ATP-binding protein [Proteobacteria bacterium]|nr:ABC transporter ATP-binding protein [Pseudomonadota bacterium]